MPLAVAMLGICCSNYISAFTDDRGCAVAVIRAGVRCFGFGDGTAVILTNVPMSVFVFVPFAAEIM